MPAYDRLGLDQEQRLAPPRNQAAEQDEQTAFVSPNLRALDGPNLNNELLSEQHVLPHPT
jgi:hypothetical protein